jgi:hypothetical protein
MVYVEFWSCGSYFRYNWTADKDVIYCLDSFPKTTYQPTLWKSVYPLSKLYDNAKINEFSHGGEFVNYKLLQSFNLAQITYSK